LTTFWLGTSVVDGEIVRTEVINLVLISMDGKVY